MLRTALAMVFAVLVALPALAQNRFAFVVGVDSYENVVPLLKARNDAQAVADALKAVGFDVKLVTDPNRRELNSAFAEFSRRLQPGDETLFYFAGHGIEIEGRNYLLAADLPALRPGEEVVATTEGIPADWVLSTLRARGARVVVLILDACRNNPFPTEGTRSLGGTGGLVPMNPPVGAFVLFSAGNGEQALDRLPDDDNPNSVFTRALLPLIAQEDLPIDELAKQLRRKVTALAETIGHPQHPAYYDELSDDYILRPAAFAPVQPSVAAEVPDPVDPCLPTPEERKLLSASSDVAKIKAIMATYASCDGIAARGKARLAKVYADDCERLAGLRTVEFGELGLGAKPAVVACRTAHESNPDDPEVKAAYGRALAADKDYGLALPLLRAAIEAGNSDAGVVLGLMYQGGLGVAKDHKQAVGYFEIASDWGNHSAKAELGFIYENGWGVSRDYKKAIKLYTASADMGNGLGMDRLGHLLYFVKGTAFDPAKAVSLFQSAADAGYSGGMVNLGRVYESGPWVPVDIDKALSLYRAAAVKGNKDAVHRLGLVYLNGIGVPKDPWKAAQYFYNGVGMGNTDSMISLGNAYATGQGVGMDQIRGLRLFQRSASMGNGFGMANLGRAFENGLGVGQSNVFAAIWYLKAAKSGYILDGTQFNSLFPETITAIQQKLGDAGVYDGPIDGRLRQDLRDALDRYGKSGDP